MVSVAAPTSTIELYSDEALLEPYPRYEQLRALGPAVWLEAHGMYALPRFAECKEALRQLARLLVRTGRDDERPHERDAHRHRPVRRRRGARGDAQGHRRAPDPFCAGGGEGRHRGRGGGARRAVGGQGHVRCRDRAGPPPARDRRVEAGRPPGGGPGAHARLGRRQLRLLRPDERPDRGGVPGGAADGAVRVHRVRAGEAHYQTGGRRASGPPPSGGTSRWRSPRS